MLRMLAGSSLIAAAGLFVEAATPTKHTVQRSVVWPAQADGYKLHHVHGLARTGNVVLAFSEARISELDDGPHDLSLRRSTDGGRTWSRTIRLAGGDNASWANPTPVVDPASGDVILLYARGHRNESSRLFLRRSSDAGLTWSQPMEFTALLEDDPLERRFHLPGPGHGIALSSGRLVVPVWSRQGINVKEEQRLYCVRALYSDDGGITWQAGAPTDAGVAANESRIIERADGTLYLNARRLNSHTDRAVAVSRDGGMTWTRPVLREAPSRFFPTDAGFIHLLHRGEHLVFSSRPDDMDGRTRMTVSVSRDGGKTWPIHRLIDPGASFYSDLVDLGGGHIGLIYGAGGSHRWLPVEVRFARVPIDWLLHQGE
jgi:Neuraminidase (sialidase)